MRKAIIYKNINTRFFKKNLLRWAQNFSHVAYYDSNNEHNPPHNFSFNNYETIVAIDKISELMFNEKDNFEKFKNFYEKTNDWIFGFLTYDLKNELEDLKSDNYDDVQMPIINFFQPKLIFFISRKRIKVEYFNDYTPRIFVENIVKQIKNYYISDDEENKKISFNSRLTKNQYVSIINDIKEHIYKGDIYEMNYCFEFFSERKSMDPVVTYLKLNELSPTPFSCFYKLYDKYLLSASPERFLMKKENQIISQPIKGTARRGNSINEDKELIKELKTNEKELSENVMIVDLVRNDLSKSASDGSVKVLEMFGIYTFPQVHQMISTIGSTLDSKIHFTEVIKDCFPMGSMTGAPKVKAMELIEKYEMTKRGLYSGAVGYISPVGDFDFNVIIRSIIYNKNKKYISYMVGSAITANSDPEKEYEECLLKAEAMKQVFE